MDSVGFGRQRHIEPVVDEDPRTVRSRAGDCLTRESGQRARSKILFTDLDQLTARPRGPLERFQLRLCTRVRVVFRITGIGLAAEARSIGDQIDQSLPERQDHPVSPIGSHWSLWKVTQIGRAFD